MKIDKSIHEEFDNISKEIEEEYKKQPIYEEWHNYDEIKPELGQKIRLRHIIELDCVYREVFEDGPKSWFACDTNNIHSTYYWKPLDEKNE